MGFQPRKLSGLEAYATLIRSYPFGLDHWRRENVATYCPDSSKPVRRITESRKNKSLVAFLDQVLTKGPSQQT
jgi:hypothetical protein